MSHVQSPVHASSSSKAASASGTSATAPPPKIVLKPEVMSSFRPSKVFKAPQYLKKDKQITSIDFDDKAEICVTASDDDSVRVWSLASGTHHKEVRSQKYGVDHIRFTHSSSVVIYASTKGNHDIRRQSLHENRYLDYYSGHTERVCSLAMNPVYDNFLSAAPGDSVKLWDIRSHRAEGSMDFNGHATVAFDPTGEVFAIGVSEHRTVLLYAKSQFTAHPFLQIEIEDDEYLSRISMPPRPAVITSLTFSPAASSGHLLVGTAGDQHYIVDTWEDAYKWRLVGHQGLERAKPDGSVFLNGPPPAVPEQGISGEELCWSPDGNYVLAGSANGQICVWKIPDKNSPPPKGADITLEPITKFDGPVGPVRALAFNHKAAVLASGGNAAAFWLPPFDEDAEE